MHNRQNKNYSIFCAFVKKKIQRVVMFTHKVYKNETDCAKLRKYSRKDCKILICTNRTRMWYNKLVKRKQEVVDMASILDVAKYILTKKGSMTTMKLEKLCYYSQAWSLAWDELPIFDEDFQAWANGPVCPDLFYKHRGKFVVDSNFISDAYGKCNLSNNQMEIIDKVLDCYGDKEPNWLSALTHLERPWKDARERGHAAPGDSCNEVITKEEMLDYYGGLQ